MSSESPTARELTRRLISQASPPGGDPDVAAVSARDACERVALEFSRWVGTRGYDALMSRVLGEVRATHPALDQIHYRIKPEPALTGLEESIERHGAAATALALASLLETILSLLTRLIGEDLVENFVEKSMQNATRTIDRVRNLDEGSATS